MEPKTQDLAFSGRYGIIRPRKLEKHSGINVKWGNPIT
jgi:hypothetical protein